MMHVTRWIACCLVLGLLSGLVGCGDTNTTIKQFDCEADSECQNSHACQGGKCVRADNDNDTWAKGKDCDDNNEFIYPGAPEICENKADDNCNGKIDEEPCICKEGAQRECGPKDVGICKPGRQICKNRAWGDCVGSIDGSVEDCNGLDDNCNGKIDEELTGDCYTGKAGTKDSGACKGGKKKCNGGTWGKCEGEVTPTDKEACNGEDDDCDGIIDNGLVRDCYEGPDNTKGRGECKGGSQVCLAGTWSDCNGAVKPVPEDCDGKDNDCNGKVDEGLASEKCYNGPATSKNVGACREGVRNCDGGKWTACTGEVVPAPQESCGDKVDNNCDGNIDEGCQGPMFEIRTSINTDTGKIDGILSPGWGGGGKFQLDELRIPQGARVKVTGNNPLTLTVKNSVEIIGTLDLSGVDGQSTNCQTSNSGQGGAGGGGGGGKGGGGGSCNISGAQPNAADGGGGGAGKGGKGAGDKGGAGGGAGHAKPGLPGQPTGNGGTAGIPVGSPTTISPGGGGGGGACGAAGTSILGVYTPGAGGGGGGGAVQIESKTANITISGNIIANGGNGGTAPTCGGGLTPQTATGGGGGGGAGGAVRIRAKGEVIIKNTAFITTTGGKGSGTTGVKGGDASEGRIRFQDADGKVTFPASRISPAPTLATY